MLEVGYQSKECAQWCGTARFYSGDDVMMMSELQLCHVAVRQWHNL